MLGHDGRPVLTGALDVTLARRRGPDVAAAPADVRDLVGVALDALGPAPDGAAGPVRAALTAGVDGAADDLARACYAALPARPIAMPAPADAGLAEAERAPRGPGADVGVPRRRGRRRRRRRAAGVRVPAAVAAVALAAAVAWGVTGHRADDAGRTRDPVADPGRPVQAAVVLTRVRADVLATGDPARLDAVEVRGAPAHLADVALLDRLRAAGDRIDGLTLRVDDAEPSTGAATATRDVAVVVTSAASAYRVLGPDGAVERTVPASPARTVRLLLRWTPEGWRVTDVRPACQDARSPGSGSLGTGAPAATHAAASAAVGCRNRYRRRAGRAARRGSSRGCRARTRRGPAAARRRGPARPPGGAARARPPGRRRPAARGAAT